MIAWPSTSNAIHRWKFSFGVSIPSTLSERVPSTCSCYVNMPVQTQVLQKHHYTVTSCFRFAVNVKHSHVGYDADKVCKGECHYPVNTYINSNLSNYGGNALHLSLGNHRAACEHMYAPGQPLLTYVCSRMTLILTCHKEYMLMI